MRLKLYVKFSRDRMTKLEQMRSNPKTTERGRQTHDMLEDFLAVYDELNDNIDMYVGRKDDIRKPLKADHRGRHRISVEAARPEELREQQCRRREAI